MYSSKFRHSFLVQDARGFVDDPLLDFLKAEGVLV